LEFELSNTAENLSQRYHQAAEKLSAVFDPGEGGLTQVYQLLLTASWYKAKADFIKSWHALGLSILEAQEMGKFEMLDCFGR
jgi:hypothetical protein